MHLQETHIVPKGTPHTRLSDYAQGIFAQLPSRKSVKKAIKNGLMHVNGEPRGTGFFVEAGQQIDLFAPDFVPPKIFPLELEVVFEDDWLAVINKPAGFEVSGNAYRTIENALGPALQASTQADALPWPRPVHRLDRLTSGLLLIAKTRRVRAELGQMLADRQVKKQYQAIVMGLLPGPERGRWTSPVKGKASSTLYQVLGTVPDARNGGFTKLALWPETGRTHQLRVHCAESGHPIVGDAVYGEPGNVLTGKGLFLCAVGLQFLHPVSGDGVELGIEAPRKFARLWARRGEKTPHSFD